MLCPVCHEDLVIVEVDGVEVDLCVTCHGLWFDRNELGMLLDERADPEMLIGLEHELAQLDERPSPHRRRCPRCRRILREFLVPAEPEPTPIDRCPAGDGLWFDRNEIDGILAARLPGGAFALKEIQEQLARLAGPGPATEKENRP